MARGNIPLSEAARSIFDDLGYSVTDDGETFRAVRDWKEVHVTTETPEECSPGGRLNCVVTWADETTDVTRDLGRAGGGGEWAVIGVRDDGDYEVARAP
jgi:hypothetical protein